jgi:hypothetical protein
MAQFHLLRTLSIKPATRFPTRQAFNEKEASGVESQPKVDYPPTFLLFVEKEGTIFFVRRLWLVYSLIQGNKKKRCVSWRTSLRYMIMLRPMTKHIRMRERASQTRDCATSFCIFIHGHTVRHYVTCTVFYAYAQMGKIAF